MPAAGLRFLLLKPDDVPTYVDYGAADLGARVATCCSSGRWTCTSRSIWGWGSALDHRRCSGGPPAPDRRAPRRHSPTFR